MDQSSAALLAKVTVSSAGLAFLTSKPFRPHLSQSRRRTYQNSVWPVAVGLLRQQPRQTRSRPKPTQHRDNRGTLLVATQQLGVRQGKAGKDGRRAKRRACLALTVVAVADVEGQGLGSGCLELDGSALAAGVHCRYLSRRCCFNKTSQLGLLERGRDREQKADVWAN